MKSVKPDILGQFATDLCLETIDVLVAKGLLPKNEASKLFIRVAEKNEALDKDSSTSVNKEIAVFARDVEQAFSSHDN